MTPTPPLPELPEAYKASDFAPDVEVFDAGQMHAYAAEAVRRSVPDLEQFREVISEYRRIYEAKDYAACAGFHYVSAHKHRERVEEADRLLALIDRAMTQGASHDEG